VIDANRFLVRNSLPKISVDLEELTQIVAERDQLRRKVSELQAELDLQFLRRLGIDANEGAE